MTLVRGNARRILNSPLYTEDICVIRQDGGARNKYGEYVAGRDNIYDLKASIEPIDPESASFYRNILPEGNRIIDARFFYIETTDPDFLKALRVGDFGQSQRDIIEHNHIRYIVRRVADYSQHGHIEVLATRQENQDD